ncbi:MAG: hypothetical protein JWP91_4111 [Fibrobacteres bacterium]|nr:hypothetical protein [Fibrobacterota bacterium]
MQFPYSPGLASGKALGRLAMHAMLATLVLGCAGRKTTLGDGKPAPEAAQNPIPDSSKANAVSVPRAEADAYWEHRGDPDTARLALGAYLRAVEAVPPDAALLGRVARAYYLVANYVETDGAKKDSLFLKGVEAAERGMALHPGFAKVFQATKDEKKAVRELGLESIDVIYWYSANLGKWASDKSLMVRLGNKSKLEAYSKRVLELDENYFHGAAHRFFGALPTKVPGGDLNESKRHFEKAIAIEPNYFGTRTLYAELYATKARDKDTFTKQLDYVIATPAGSLPDAEPENRYEQAIARQLKEKTHEWFD